MIDRFKHRLSLLTYAWRTVGPATMLRNAVRWSLDGEARNSNTDFDARFGTETTTELTPDEAAIPLARRDVATMYLPTIDADFESMLTALAWPASLEQAATFVDVGSGKGRVVLLAGMRRFREVVGIELSPVLHETAQRNVDIMHARGALESPVRLLLGDATELAVSGGPLIAYLYHPFQESIASLVVDRIVASLIESPRPAAILYGHPTLQQPFDPTVFTRGGVFAEHARGQRATSFYKIGWSIWTNETWAATRYMAGA